MRTKVHGLVCTLWSYTALKGWPADCCDWLVWVRPHPPGSTNQTSDANSMMLPIQAPSCPMRPEGVRVPSGLYMCNVETNMPASRKMCLVGSIITSIVATTRHRKGPQRSSNGRSPRLLGVFTATNVSILMKAARLSPQLRVCASLRLPALSIV